MVDLVRDREQPEVLDIRDLEQLVDRVRKDLEVRVVLRQVRDIRDLVKSEVLDIRGRAASLAPEALVGTEAPVD